MVWPVNARVDVLVGALDSGGAYFFRLFGVAYINSLALCGRDFASYLSNLHLVWAYDERVHGRPSYSTDSLRKVVDVPTHQYGGVPGNLYW